ncbi:MAG: hypothetical protein AAGC68_01045, partial [Verrucomicrobiota bacterium]
SSKWQATVTPLASIMGSGFLVSAPLLAGQVGNLALFCMATLLAVAFAVGGAIRFNIRHFEPIENEGHGPAQVFAFLSRIVLAVAYFISVVYYLQLLAAFVLDAIGVASLSSAPMITSGLLLLITGIGMWKGLGLLERLEKYTVALNLGMIGALLVGLAFHNGALFFAGNWKLPEIESAIDLPNLRVLLGLLIVVQGFETSRYMGSQHSADERIGSMRFAQLLSAGIYLVFIGLSTVLFHEGLGADVTAIIAMTSPVAIVLPLLLSIAAIGSQFSAAVADTEGCGGLVGDLTRDRVPMRYAYFLILLVTVFITWETNVNEIIAYASRAFALYYMLQCVVALLILIRNPSLPNRHPKAAGFGFLAIVCLIVFSFGLPAE